MKTYILVYKEFAHFEVILASYFLKTKGDIITVGLNKEPIKSIEGFNIIPDITLDEFSTEDCDIFIVPGGDPNNLEGCKKLYEILFELNNKECIIGAICGGPVHLARANILRDRKYTTSLGIDEYKEFESNGYENTNVVVDKNLITAKASGYVDFAIDLGKLANIYEDEGDLAETIDFFKFFKS